MNQSPRRRQKEEWALQGVHGSDTIPTHTCGAYFHLALQLCQRAAALRLVGGRDELFHCSRLGVARLSVRRLRMHTETFENIRKCI